MKIKTGHTCKDYYDSYMELDVVVVTCWEPAEPEVGFLGNVTIERVLVGDHDILHTLTKDQISDLEDEAVERATEKAESDAADYGDYLYEQERDRRLEE